MGEKIKKFELIQTSEYPDFDLKITLKPSFRCNQNCWFCDEYDNSATDWTKDDCDLVIDKLKEIPKSKKKLFIYFYGGEPTLSEYWEYLHFELVNIFKDRELFIQTQTNLSVSKNRLKRFLIDINIKKQNDHKIDICSSYHIGKQTVEVFKEKLDICNESNALGLIMFSTEQEKENQTIDEFNYIKEFYNNKIKFKFTIDKQKISDYTYFMNKYNWVSSYLEEGFNFKVDNKIMNYAEIKERKLHRFKLMKCECGIKNIVIDNNLNVYYCNDDFYSGIKTFLLNDVNFSNFNNKNTFCLNNCCDDGLEFKKWR